MTNHNKKIFFISDFHLGAPNYAASLEREKIIVQFLMEKDANYLCFLEIKLALVFLPQRTQRKNYTKEHKECIAKINEEGIPTPNSPFQSLSSSSCFPIPYSLLSSSYFFDQSWYSSGDILFSFSVTNAVIAQIVSSLCVGP